MATRHLLLPLALLLGAAAPVQAAPAKPAADSPGVDIPYERYVLPNGLEVILHRDSAAPLVVTNFWYHVGSGDETPGKSGFAHLFEHMMFQGAKHIGNDVHFKILQEIGGTGINGTTNSDRTNYFEVVPSHQLETALWLESDRMGYMLDLLDEKSLANQRDVVRNERRQRYDNVPYGRERFAVAEALYPEGHPYRYLTIGRHEDLEAASVADVQGFFRKWYVPSNATLTIAGDFEPEQAKALVQKWFGSFPTLPQPAHQQIGAPALTQTVRRELDDPFARLYRIHYAWHSPPRLGGGDIELEVLADVLGSPGWGRLYKALVLEDKSAQSVSAYQGGAGHSGTFHVIVDLKPGQDPVKAELTIRRELERILREPVSDAELKRVVVGTESSFVWGLEDVMGRVERLQYFNHYARDPGYANTYLQRLRAVTPQRVREVANQWLVKPHAEILTKPAAPPPGPPEGTGPKGPGASAKPDGTGAKKPAPEASSADAAASAKKKPPADAAGDAGAKPAPKPKKPAATDKPADAAAAAKEG
ncbi:M16 family metallopeptidase [Nannocystis punicea]|uniref:Pitrilysin family protein n=1 Tax=Nannocystis punicea TaxID=2995304 RepID=A0ABY7H2F5_9BACT|nr:pitrilysin family protein [Nannocystis poenicansa]WAS93204.1 pitrilysin family protein [Nannocystis poenicansa]